MLACAPSRPIDHRETQLGLTHAYSAQGWENLFVALAGASAALAGLLVVAVSINLSRILAYPGLPGRAGEAVVLLVTVLVVAVLGLVPGQPRWVLAAELLATGLIAWSALTSIHVRAIRGHTGPTPSMLARRVVLAQAAMLSFPAAGASLLLGGGGGLYWLVPGVVLCLVVAVMEAWVLLIEILR